LKFVVQCNQTSSIFSPSAAFLDELTVEDEATTIRQNVSNHTPSVKASQVSSPNTQTQCHYNIKSHNVQYVLLTDLLHGAESFLRS